MDTCLPTQDPPVQCRPDLLDPKGSLSLCLAFSVCLILSLFLSLTLWHTYSTYIQTTLNLKGHREKKREMAPVIFPLLTGALQRSLSQSPRGEDIKQRKNLSHFIVFYHRELISLFSLCLTLLSYSSHSSSPPSPQSLYIFFLSIFYQVWRFDNALWACQLVKNTEGKEEKKGGGHFDLEKRAVDVRLRTLSNQGDFWRAEGQAGSLTLTSELHMLTMCK